ncbi:MAG: DALR domain-containing protein, partial [Pseudomonadota bacterium]
VLFELASNINKTSSHENASLLKALGGLLGLLQQNPQDYLQYKNTANESNLLAQNKIEDLIQQRIRARKEGRFEDADTIRKNLLLEDGVILEDNASGTTWRRQ